MNIYIKVTEKCNLRCLHCYNPYIAQEIDYDALIKFLKQVQNAESDNYFILHGGEPMMATPERILDLVQEFSSISWRISTNLCYPLTDTRLKILKYMKEIRISFDIGIRFGSLQNLLLWKHNVQYLSNHTDIPLFLNICLTHHLLKHHPKHILSMMQHLGFKQFALERITLKGRAQDNKTIIPSYEEINTWLCQLYYSLKEYPDIKCLDIETIRSSISNIFDSSYGPQCCCKAITINADGTIGNCPNDAHDKIIGDISHNFNSIVSKLYCNKHNLHKECLVCDEFKYCHGYCPQMEWQDTICPYPKQLLKEILKNEYSSKLHM